MRRIRSHLSYANVMATIAVFVALGGTSYAVSQLPRNSVGAKQIRTSAVGSSELRSGAVRSGDIRNRSVALRDISTGARRSLRGGTGPAGPQGPPGASAVTMSAAVNDVGTFARSQGTSGGRTTHSIGSGLYQVDFARDLASCYVAATISATRARGSSGEIATEIDGSSVYVQTSESNGADLDLPFHLIVSC